MEQLRVDNTDLRKIPVIIAVNKVNKTIYLV